MLSSKRTSFFSNLLSNSQSDDLSNAAREWKMNRIGHSEQFSPCECCGTAMKRHAIIENKITGATLIIGLNCLENLKCTQEGMELPSLKEYVATGKAILRGKVKQFYEEEEDIPIDFKSWRNWFLSLENIPDELKEGIAQLRYWGILSDEYIDAFIRYHDDTRLFPGDVLIPDDIHQRLTQSLSISIPDFLTVNQARKYLAYKDKKICPECGLIVDSKSMKPHLLKQHNFRQCSECGGVYKDVNVHLVKGHGYSKCPICNEPFRYIEIHLRSKHKSELCPKCDTPVKLDEFDNHLHEVHGYRRCPVCKKILRNVDSHLIRNHGYSKCPVCKISIGPGKINNHLAKHGLIKCLICGEIIKQSEVVSHKCFGTHDIGKDKNKMYQCPQCDTMVKGRNFVRHMRKVHKMVH